MKLCVTNSILKKVEKNRNMIDCQNISSAVINYISVLSGLRHLEVNGENLSERYQSNTMRYH